MSSPAHFHLLFEFLTDDKVEVARSGLENNLVIARLVKLLCSEDGQRKRPGPNCRRDLIDFADGHKLSATLFGKRAKVPEALSSQP